MINKDHLNWGILVVGKTRVGSASAVKALRSELIDALTIAGDTGHRIRFGP
jgi:hypothetical protein